MSTTRSSTFATENPHARVRVVHRHIANAVSPFTEGPRDLIITHYTYLPYFDRWRGNAGSPETVITNLLYLVFIIMIIFYFNLIFKHRDLKSFSSLIKETVYSSIGDIIYVYWCQNINSAFARKDCANVDPLKLLAIVSAKKAY